MHKICCITETCLHHWKIQAVFYEVTRLWTQKMFSSLQSELPFSSLKDSEMNLWIIFRISPLAGSLGALSSHCCTMSSSGAALLTLRDISVSDFLVCQSVPRLAQIVPTEKQKTLLPSVFCRDKAPWVGFWFYSNCFVICSKPCRVQYTNF